MGKGNSINEAELIVSGKAMMQSGLGARFVLQKMKEAIEDEEIRARVMTAILEKSSPLDNNQSQQQLLHDRKVRQARHAIEDFNEAIDKLKRSSFTGVLFAFLLLFFGLSFGSNNFIFAILTLVTAIGLWFSRNRVNWKDQSTTLTMIAGWLLFFIIEMIIFGLPDQLIPGVGIAKKYDVIYLNAFLNFINQFTWLIYIFVRLFMILPLLMIFYRKKELEKISTQYLEAAKK